MYSVNRQIRASLPFQVLIVFLFLTWMPHVCVAEDTPPVAETPKVIKPLDGPAWAQKIYVGLIAERAKPAAPQGQQTGSAAKQNGEAEKSPTKLFELDTEVDMLASALLTLERPEAVVDLYNKWYNTNPESVFESYKPQESESIAFRTPAATLLYSRALRNQALSLLETPGLKLNRLEAFERANQLLNQAEGKLKLQINSVVTKRENSFGRWLQEGLPKPNSLDDLKPKAKCPTHPFPAFQAIDYFLAYLEWHGQIQMELGDIVYRVTGGTGKPSTGQNAGDQNPTAAAYYVEARQSIFLARLIDKRNKRLASMGTKIDDRMKWLVGNRPFGGHDFFQFEPTSNVNSWTHWETQLQRHIDSMMGDYIELRTQREKALSWVSQIQENDRNSEMLQQQFKFEMNFAVREKIADLNLDLSQIKTGLAQSALENAYRETDQFISESSLELDKLVYEQTLEREKRKIIGEAIGFVGDIRRGGALSSFRASFFPDEAQMTLPAPTDGTQPEDTEIENLARIAKRATQAERREDLGMVLGMVQADRQLAQTWSNVYAAAGADAIALSAPGLVDAKTAIWRATSIQLEMAIAKLRRSDGRKQLDDLKNKMPDLEANVATIVKRMEDEKAAYEGQQKAEVAKLEGSIQKTILGRANEEVENAVREVGRVEAQIKKFREYVQQARKTMATAKQWSDNLEKAYDQFKNLSFSYSEIPVTITGPSGGVITDVGEKFEKKGRAALDKIKATLDKVLQSKDFDEFLRTLDAEAEKLETNLAKFRNEVEQKKAELNIAILKSEWANYVAVPDATVLRNIEDAINGIKDVQVNELRSKIQKIHEQYNKEISGTAFPLNEFTELGDRLAIGASNRVELLDQKIQAELDRAYAKLRTQSGFARRAVERWRAEESAIEKRKGELFEQYIRQRVDREEKLKSAEIAKAVAEAEANAISSELANAERDDLQKLVEEMKQREVAARSEMVTAATDQETAWLQLVNTAKYWNLTNSQSAELTQWSERFQARLDELKATQSARKSELDSKLSELDNVLSEQDLRLLQLAGELKQLNQPQGRMVTAAMLERLSPALVAMQDSGDVQERLRRGVDEGNVYLAEYGRWLYLLSGKRECLTYSSRCESLNELRLAKEELDRIAHQVQSAIGATQTEVAIIRLPPSNYQRVQVTSSTNEKPIWASLIRSANGVELKFDENTQADDVLSRVLAVDASKVLDKDANDNDVDTNNRTAHIFNDQQPKILVGFTHVIRWKEKFNPQAQAHVQPVGFSLAGLDASRTLPFKYLFRNQNSGSFASYRSVAELIESQLLSQRRDSTSVMLEPSKYGIPNSQYFGRSALTTFAVSLSETSDVEGVDLFLFYLTPATSQPVTPLKTTIAASEIVSGLKDQDKDLTKAGDVPKSFAEKWKNTEWLKSYSETVGTNSSSLKTETEKYQHYLKNNKLDPNPDDLLKPISLQWPIETATALLKALNKDVKKVEDDLNAAAEAVKNRISPNRAALTAINNAVDIENRRFRNLQEHVRRLEMIDQVISGTRIDLSKDNLDRIIQATENPQTMRELVLLSLVERLSLDGRDDALLVNGALETLNAWIKVQIGLNKK